MDHCSEGCTGKTGSGKGRLALLLSSLLISILLLSSCDLSTPSAHDSVQSRTFTGSSTQPITYSINAHDVLIRTFYGGGLAGSFSLGPQLSIYGDGTYIIGLDRQGKLTTEELQTLLNTLVNNYRLLNFARQQFSDNQDENATFLELALNGKQEEFVYGTLDTTEASAQELDEYHRLGDAITTINEALKGPTQPYNATTVALLVRQTFSPDLQKTIPSWPISDFTLAQAAVYECGIVPADETSQNAETACLKFVIPSHAILLNTAQVRAIKEALRGSQGDFTEQGLYYSVILRPLLPDESIKKILAMFGSAQGSYRGVPLLSGMVPPAPDPTPS
jgi:hypothetical protein